MKNNASLIYTVFLALGDLLALGAAFVAAFIFRVTLSDVPPSAFVTSVDYLQVLVTLLPFWILIFALLGLYNSNIYEKRFSEFGRLVIGSFIGLLFVIFYDFLLVAPIFPAKLVPIYGFVLAFLTLLVFRNLARALRSALFGFDVGISNILIVGNTAIADELRRTLADSRQSGYRVLGVVGDSTRQHHADFKTFATALRHISEGEDRRQLQAIFQTELYPNDERNREILDYAQEHHISYRFIPGNTELFVGNIDVELFRSSIPVIAVRQTPLFGWGNVVKRLFDLIFGTVLLLFALPFIAVICLLMYLFDHGEPIFRQARLSRYNTTFYIYKFRTHLHAYNGLSPEQAFAKMGRPELAAEYRHNGDFLADDPRISRLGRFLRATSLDELPQILNVLKGQLSLVGPRPLVPFELETFNKKSLVLSVKPGLTGLAAVSGRRNIPFEERRKLDMFYVQNWSFWLDLVILAKTIRVVLDRTGAR